MVVHMSNTATCHTEGCENTSESYSILCWCCAKVRARKMHAGTAARRDAAIGEIVVDGVRLPAMFYDDHADRGCPAGREISRNSRSVTVDLDAAAIDDLRSDARHYADGDDYDGGMRSAARSMLTALDRNGL